MLQTLNSYHSDNPIGALFFFQVNHTQRAIGSLTKDFLLQRKLPLRTEQLFVFLCIYNLGIVTQTELANYVMRDKASIQRTVSNFITNNLVISEADINDKRKAQISLTDKGKLLAADIYAFLSDMDHQYLDHFNLTSNNKMLEL